MLSSLQNLKYFHLFSAFSLPFDSQSYLHLLHTKNFWNEVKTRASLTTMHPKIRFRPSRLLRSPFRKPSSQLTHTPWSLNFAGLPAKLALVVRARGKTLNSRLTLVPTLAGKGTFASLGAIKLKDECICNTRVPAHYLNRDLESENFRNFALKLGKSVPKRTPHGCKTCP